MDHPRAFCRVRSLREINRHRGDWGSEWQFRGTNYGDANVAFPRALGINRLNSTRAFSRRSLPPKRLAPAECFRSCKYGYFVRDIITGLQLQLDILAYIISYTYIQIISVSTPASHKRSERPTAAIISIYLPVGSAHRIAFALSPFPLPLSLSLYSRIVIPFGLFPVFNRQQITPLPLPPPSNRKTPRRYAQLGKRASVIICALAIFPGALSSSREKRTARVYVTSLA